MIANDGGMRSAALTLAFLVAICQITLSRSSTTAEDDGCGLYLAESSIKNAGWGVFAGADYAQGESLGGAGLGIQVLDPDSFEDERMIQAFLWESALIGGGNEAHLVGTLLPGIASLANHHSVFHNVFEGGLSFDDMFDRQNHPMAGASTSYHGYSFTATKQISAGDEIFTGRRLFTRVADDWFRSLGLTTKKDFGRANTIITGLCQYRDKHPELSENQWIDVLYRLRHEILSGEEQDTIGVLLPRTLEELNDIDESGSAEGANLETRDLAWLRQNGRCLDNIVEGESKIIGAGRGAFATRFISKGSVVAPSPLVQIMKKDALNTQRQHNATQQLLMNYCFGHRRSPLLLCPTTHVTLINHHAEKANTRLQWAKTPANLKSEKINFHLSDLDDLGGDPDSTNSRLMFEFVATTDIHPNEEIYLNYGDEWIEAFQKHHQSWSRRPDDGYVPAKTMNLAGGTLVMPWEPNSSSHYSYECRIEPLASEKLRATSTLDYYSNPATNISAWDAWTKMLVNSNENLAWHPCIPVSRSDDKTTFHVQVFSKLGKDRKIIRDLDGVPLDAIRYADKPYHSNQHLGSAFRHFIPIPDAIFPSRWRDDYVPAAAFGLGSVNRGLDTTQEENRLYQAGHEARLRMVKCGEYFAPSNIPNAGFGIYSAVSIVGRGVVLGTALPAIPVPVRPGPTYDINNYVWGPPAFDLVEYETFSDTPPKVMAVNNGALANFHPGLVNAELSHARFTPTLDRCTDPGAGAFSYYTGYSFISSNALKAGEEVFVSYGEPWFTDRTAFVDVPLNASYREANDVVSSLWALSNQEGNGLDDHQISDLLLFARNELVSNHRTKATLDRIGKSHSLADIIRSNGTAQATVEIRTQEWLEENGQCIDHVYVKASTIPQAGSGAFTRRFLAKGTTIISTPLVATYGLDAFNFDVDKIPADANPTLLFLNYQFSHPNSSLYLFPINQALAINHGSDRNSQRIAPNAEVRWSPQHKKGSYFRERMLDDLKQEHYSTMVLDFVATRDIQVDEEVLIDYGIEWEQAWDEHVKNFRSPCEDGTKSSIFVAAMNNRKHNKEYHKWSDDHFTVCQGEGKEGTRIGLEEGYEVRGIRWDHEGFNHSKYQKGESTWTPCVILDSYPDQDAFEVAFIMLEKDEAMEKEVRYLNTVLGIPSGNVRFISKPFRSDSSWSGAFRHAIKIPDFPDHWKDLL